MTSSILQSTESRRRLLAYISRRNRNPANSEDILQETLLRLVEQSEKREIDDPMAYAYRVADSIIFALARKRRLEIELGDADFASNVPAGDDVLEYKQRTAMFRDALLALPRVRREVFVKRHLEGKSRQHIADELGLTVEGVKKHLVRAMAELSYVFDGTPSTASDNKNKRADA